MKHRFSEYMDASKDLFKLIFGEELFNQLNSHELTPFNWEGLDITECFDITATNPDIKDRFTDKWIEYYKELNYTPLDLFIQSIFHYGYNQKWEDYQGKDKIILEKFEKIIKENMK